MDQFVTRFLLRETVSQLQALQSSLEGASDTLEAQARGQRYVRGLLARGLVCVCLLFLHSKLLSAMVYLTFLDREAMSWSEGIDSLGTGIQIPRRSALPHLSLVLCWNPGLDPVVGLGIAG